MGAMDPYAAESKDARMWGMLCHLAGFLGYLIPFGNIVGPLVIWLVKKEEFPYVDRQGREAVNFQITFSIYAAICFALAFIVIGIPLLFIGGIFHVVFMIIAAVRANDGEYYRYPLTIRFM